MNIKRNMGTAERWIRFAGGLAAIVVAAALWAKLPLWGAILLVLLGVGTLIEAALSWCPLKTALGLGKRNEK
jgi:hypothetical protein